MERRGLSLGKTVTHRSYQLLCKVRVEHSTQETWQLAVSKIYEWLYKKCRETMHSMPYQPSTYRRESAGISVGSLHQPDIGYYTMRFSHPDRYLPSRVWISEAEVRIEDQEVIFAVRQLCSFPFGQNVPVPFSIPAYVYFIANDIGIIDVATLRNCPRDLKDSQEQVDWLANLICAQDRFLPVVVLTENNFTPYQDEMSYAGALAKNLYCAAHIVYLQDAATYKLAEKLGETWNVYNGAVRTYYPGIDLDTSDIYAHPLATRERILATSFDSENGELTGYPAFRVQLEQYIKAYDTRKRVNWADCGCSFYYNAYQEFLATSEKSSNTNQQTIELLREQVQVYEEKIEEQKQEVDEALDMATDQEAAMQEQREINHALRQTISVLEHRLEAAEKQPAKESIPVVDNYEDIDLWVQTNLAGKLFLHKRAKRALKNAAYEDVHLVCKSLILIAHEYRNMKMGLISRDEFECACGSLEVEESKAITETGAGSHGEEYYVKYNGQKYLLERHLKKGGSRDPRYCMRIYYFWHDEDEMVIVGSLPGHLDNSLT